MRVNRAGCLFLALPIVGACAGPTPLTQPSDATSDPDFQLSPDTKKVVWGSSRTYEGTAPGLCTGWSVTLVDPPASPLGGGFVHASGDGFGVGDTTPRAIRISRAGALLGEAIFPLEDAAGVADVIPSGDEWVVAWAQSSGALYFVSYDASGAPLARSGTQPNGSRALLGTDPNGAIDVAWANTEPGLVSGPFSLGSIAGVGPTSFGPGVLVGAPSGEEIFAWQGGRLYSLTVTVDGAGRGFHYSGAHLRAWDVAGHLTLDTPVPSSAAGPSFAVTAPGLDGASAILVNPNEVTFASATEEIVWPTDISLNYPSALATPGGVTVASLEALAGDGGAEAGIQLVEIAPTGARSPRALVPFSTRETGSLGAVRMAATEDGNAVLVIADVMAVVTCTGRS